MGITGELVRSVFSRSRSFGTHESTVRSINVGEKSRWSSVRSYLCGDEFNSVLAEEDSASVKSSEATVTQPITEHIQIKQNQEITKEETAQEKHNSASNLFRQEDAAVTIQSAFRAFLARRRTSEESKTIDKKPEPVVVGSESPSGESVGTSVEVQTGNSTEAFSVKEQLMADHRKIQQKARSQVLRLKEDWDDSTVSSNISRMRIQNRLEACTRRERALAYAFSQQLRICAKKKQARSDGTEANMGWNWLERWMATRIPDSPSFENHMSKQFEPIKNNHGFMAKKRFLDLTGEEMESCGSNEVPAQFDSFSVTSPNEKDMKPVNNSRLKPTRAVSKRKTVPSNHCPKDYVKVSKNECTVDADKHKKKQPGLKKEMKCSDNSSPQSPHLPTSEI